MIYTKLRLARYLTAVFVAEAEDFKLNLGEIYIFEVFLDFFR